MLRILQISFTFLFVIIGTTSAQTTEALLFPKCQGDICSCSSGTHEAVYNGRKYCAPDNTDSCPEHAVRLSAQVCECKKGYRFRTDDRKECESESMGGEPEPDYDGSMGGAPEPDYDGDGEVIETEISTKKVEMPTTTTTQSTTTPLPTNITTTPATLITTTRTDSNTTSLDESETRSNTLYIYIGIGVMAIAALLLIVILYILRKQ